MRDATVRGIICTALIAGAAFGVATEVRGKELLGFFRTRPAKEIHLGQWWVTLFSGGVGGNLDVGHGRTVLSGRDTINFGYGSLGQLGALHSTGSFRPLKHRWSHNIYSIGYGGAQFRRATVRVSRGDLVIETDAGVTYRIPPELGGTVTVTGAKMCLVTSNALALADCAVLDTSCLPVPLSTAFQPLGTIRQRFGVQGKPGMDALVVFASGAVEAHNDNIGDHNADDLYVRLALSPDSYAFRME